MGKKIIETRFYSIPSKYLNQPLWLVETPGKNGDFDARAIAIITFSSCFKYNDKKQFYQDSGKHLIQKNSIWDWVDNKSKWAWLISEVMPLKSAIRIKSRRGIVYTKNIKLQIP